MASWGDLGASWAELGPIWAAKRAQKGGQKGPKRHQKRDQNDIKILIEFWTHFGSIWEANLEIKAWPGGMRGPWLDSLSSKNSKTISKTNLDTLRPFGWRRMTESGLERSGKRLRVALHSTKWILEGGAGGRTGPRAFGGLGWWEMTESGLERSGKRLRVALHS